MGWRHFYVICKRFLFAVIGRVLCDFCLMIRFDIKIFFFLLLNASWKCCPRTYNCAQTWRQEWTPLGSSSLGTLCNLSELDCVWCVPQGAVDLHNAGIMSCELLTVILWCRHSIHSHNDVSINAWLYQCTKCSFCSAEQWPPAAFFDLFLSFLYQVSFLCLNTAVICASFLKADSLNA